MDSYRGIDLNRLGYTSWEPGKTYGAGPGPGRVALGPADGLWEDLRRLVAEDMKHWAALDAPGTSRKPTRYDRGRLAGEIEATARALAYILVGHHLIHGDAPRIIITAVQAELRAGQEHQ